jgi:LAS superfamily LD-carboxypeptidase LdcB
VISGLLNDNKFEFHSLPTFINYRDDEMLQSVFTPQEYNNSITSCGPTFVCVYTGQHSKTLDINSGRYPNDGFDMRCNSTTIPDDFKNPLQPHEDPVAVFEVNYSQQNQNIFKDITLDQSEYSETEESLKIVQDISMNGFENKPTYAGQNMYNIYGVRAYSAEIEMLGNPMIQPMMYFQLNNIPMFHGAYMIIRTRHNIKPNHMTTWFTGSRIRAIETPLFDVADAYMSLIETLDLSKVNGGSTTVRGSFPPIVTTIIENGGSNGNVEQGNISLVDVGNIEGVYFSPYISSRKMIAEAVPALTEMLKAFVDFAKEEGYPTKDKAYIGVTSLYRSYEKQQQLYADSKKDGSVAEPGFSNHSWGLAVDLYFLPQKDGKYLKKNNWAPITTKAKSEGFSLEYNPSLKWFLDNGYKYGFIIPQTLRDKSSVEEYWHFEYHGTSAKCLYEKFPTTYGYTPKINANYKPVVKNPKGKDGVEAKYVGCDFKTINKGGDSSIGDLVFSDKSTPAKTIYDYIKQYTKLSDIAIAAIMGNFYAESRFVTGIFNSDGGNLGAYGLGQWRAERQTNLVNYAKQNNLPVSSPEAQIGFLNKELNNLFTYTLKALKDVKSESEACKIFYTTYERTTYGTKGWNESVFKTYPTPSERLTFCQQFYDKIKNNDI